MFPINCHFCSTPIIKKLLKKDLDHVCPNCKIIYEIDNKNNYYIVSYFSLKKSIHLIPKNSKKEYVFFYYPKPRFLKVYIYNKTGTVFEETLNYNPNINQIITILSKYIKYIYIKYNSFL